MKRAVITDREDFFYDIYSLVKSFYPSDEIAVFTGQDEKVNASWDEVIRLKIPEYEERLDGKNQLKRELYRLLEKKENLSLPWGTLSGIRPTKLAMRGLTAGKSHNRILEELKEIYLISPKKAELALNIAEREKRLMDALGEGMSLYLSVPFCPSICSYCTFSSSPIAIWKDSVASYLQGLEKELRELLPCLTKPLHTIYIGGGTPTTLTAEELDRLLDMLDRYLPTDKVSEFTLEAGRPDTITPEKLHVMRSHPVSRISVNPQTMNDRTLRLIGRKHSVGDTERAFEMARKAGFDNINMDIIMGLPEETETDIAHTLARIQALAPDSLTVHSLALKRASRMTLEKEEEHFSLKNTEAVMEMAEESAKAMDMKPYYLYRQKNMRGNLENVGYAREGSEGLYNILIMEEKENIAACGAGASTKVLMPDGQIKRLINPKNVTQYLERLDDLIAGKRSALLGNG